MKTKLLFTFILATCNLFAQLREIPFQDKTQEASFIIEGKILSKTSFYADDGQNIFTALEVTTYKIFKGDLSGISNENRAYIIVPGGEIEDDALIVEPNLETEIGDVGTFLLKTNSISVTNSGLPTGYLYEPTQSAQSQYNYDCDSGEVNGIFQTFPDVTNFYNSLIALSGQDIIIVESYTPCDITKASSRSIIISGFSPASVPAGAKQVLTINGSGFGATQGGGKVWFRKNSNPSAFETSSGLPIISWSDTQIQLFVPAFAGSGQIGVSAGFTSPVTYSTAGLIVPYAEININYKQTQHYWDAPGAAGGYIWQLNDVFAGNTDAVNSFNRARENWICETEMNWYLDVPTTTINTTAFDGINIVRFDPSLPSGVLGVCYSYYGSCGADYYVKELDIAFNTNINWNYTQNSPASNEFDFETVALHELGHGRQLQHVIDPTKVMHPSVSSGIQKRIISNDEIIGGLDINNRSTSFFNEICGKNAMIGIICPPAGVDDPTTNSINIYPNPVSNYINISISDETSLKDYLILDVQGRIVDKGNLLNSQAISVEKLQQGIYFLKIQNIKNQTNISKFIKN